ncbi:TMEM175 family protein [Alcanivorax sp. DP30]|uniref:TMEM175 family protein n=1 Tax=Alcanivorax sp. DP30 TaxID=2606217 RepID=UPI00136F5361|nr:TMEM175 family protein [Alcanivorax sp. DP30]MZR62762.1 DUF1211 domain-containing protein [Alcanivorax sp. DP30]
MDTHRLEALSDGVLAIAITIMVLELKAPDQAGTAGLLSVAPTFLSYILSFVYLGIHWNNHHHLFMACRTVTAPVMWANMHLLFWLSLIPLTTDWLGKSSFAGLPSAVYGFVLFMAAIAYIILQRCVLATYPESAPLRKRFHADTKGRISLLLYLAGIAISGVSPFLATTLYVFVAILWVIPDKRLATHLNVKP